MPFLYLYLHITAFGIKFVSVSLPVVVSVSLCHSVDDIVVLISWGFHHIEARAEVAYVRDPYCMYLDSPPPPVVGC